MQPQQLRKPNRITEVNPTKAPQIRVGEVQTLQVSTSQPSVDHEQKSLNALNRFILHQSPRKPLGHGKKFRRFNPLSIVGPGTPQRQHRKETTHPTRFVHLPPLILAQNGLCIFAVQFGFVRGVRPVQQSQEMVRGKDPENGMDLFEEAVDEGVRQVSWWKTGAEGGA